MAQQVR
ncbi:Protein of unknown function [Lactobacillus delbrueckii subsp. lactis]|nr:Protein of unknown function [Lactobacillus delbrueckii subsp. lactis]